MQEPSSAIVALPASPLHVPRRLRKPFTEPRPSLPPQTACTQLFQLNALVPKDGRYDGVLVVCVLVLDVSILARPEGRALQRGALWRLVFIHVSILARPEGRALRSEPKPG